MPSMAKGTTQNDYRSFSQLWRENHGNFLLGVLAIIVLVGCTLLLLPKSDNARRPFLVPGATISAEDQAELLENADSGDMDAVGLAPADDSETIVGGDTSLLQVKIIGLKGDRGVVRIAIYSDAETFNKAELADQKAVLEIKGTEATWEVRVPANQPIAIAAYHDQNENDQLDKNILGLPMEKYGFSLGERSLRGPPKFEDAAFTPQPGVIEVPLQVW